jgi:glycogen synthase
MTQDLTHWEKDWGLMEFFFNDEEIESIRKKIQALKIKHVVYCSFENRFARSGGLAAVTTKILPYLNEIKQVHQILLMAPFYPHIINETKLTSTGIIFKVMYDPWASSMANALYEVIRQAIDLYQNHQDDYYRFILEGFKQARTFTWQKAAEKYFQVYEKIKSV